MIGDLFGNIGAQQEQLKQQLDEIELVYNSQDEAITIHLTASKKINDITIDKDKLDLSETEQLEDLLLITLNQAFEKADTIAAAETQKLIIEMLPHGFVDMFSM